MGDPFVSKQTLRLVAGGALGTLAISGIGKALMRVRPAVVGLFKEGYAFKEWVAGKVERAREDVEDVVAEAKHAYYKDLEATAGSIRREREILERLEKTVEQRMSRQKPKKEEG